MATSDLRNAVRDLLQHETDRRILLVLQAGEGRFNELFKRAGTSSKNHFQRSLDRLQGHILIDRRLEAEGQRYRSTYSLTKRGQRIATAISDLAECAPRTALGQALRDEILVA